MNTLKILLQQKGVNQAWLADKLNKDKTTINRWCKNNREISWDNANKIGVVLNSHPIDILISRNNITVKLYQSHNCIVEEFKKEKKIEVDYEHQDKIIVSLDNIYYHSGYKAFCNQPTKLRTKPLEERLIYLKNKIYCGKIQIDPFSGSFYIYDNFLHKTEIIGNVNEIDKMFKLYGTKK